MSTLNKKKINIRGMHCASCEVLIERKFKQIPGIEKVKVNQSKGEAEIFYTKEPSTEDLQNAIKSDGYKISSEGSQKSSGKEYVEIGAIFVILIGLYLLFKQFNLLPNLGISNTMSYGFVFLIGLIAATSTCMAVTGGLLLAVTTKYNNLYPNLNSAQKFKPHIYFNLGRVISYTVLGGLVGLIGSAITFSPKITGIIMIVVSILMMGIGVQMLNIFPWLSFLQIKMPKIIAHKVYESVSTQNPLAPFLFGSSTFFFPCGFTQALQLYVLTKGDFATGALIMFFFSLGTLPGLLSLGALTSFVKGAIQKYVIKVSAALIILIGIFNISSGLVLAGADLGVLNSNSITGYATAQVNIDDNVKIVDGRQLVQMKVVGLDYIPSKFKVLQGIPVDFEIDGTQARGCAQVLTIPKLNIVEYLPREGTKTISFTPNELGSIPFRCTMGMTTWGAAFEVVPNTLGVKSAEVKDSASLSTCNPEIANCDVPNLNTAQKLNMEVSRENGFYPNVFTVKKNIPVELEIDAKLQLGGCMSTMVIPDYNVAHYLKLGKSILKFTPTKTGVVTFTCSMGSPLGQFIVTD